MNITAGSRHRGFTLLEVLIVVAFIGLMAAIAVPNIVRARTLSRKHTCLANLRQIENAKRAWANETLKGAGDTPTDADLFGCTSYLRTRPLCPAGGRYQLTRVDTPTECNLAVLEGHAL